MIKIHKAVITGLNTIDIHVETIPNKTIERVLIYKLADYKDPSKAVDVSFLLKKTSHVENISVEARELGVRKIDNIYIIEIKSSEENIGTEIYNEAIAIVSSHVKYEQCILERVLRIKTSGCKEHSVVVDCEDCNSGGVETACLASTLFNALKGAIQHGFFEEAKKIQEELDCLCKPCKTCPDYMDTEFYNGSGFGTFDNTIILV